jgi:hypothetical protein
MDEMKMQGIYDILLGDKRPWHKDNVNRTESYWDSFIEQKTENTLNKYMYEIKVDDWLFFTSRLRYYRREVDNAINRYLSYVTGVIDKNQKTHSLVSYLLKNTKDWVVKYIHTANQELSRYKVTDIDVISEDVDFNVQREEKEIFIILRYIIVSLIKCYLEFQSRYQHLIKEKTMFDIDSFYTEVVGRRPCKIFPLNLKSKSSVNIPPNCCFKYESESLTDDMLTLHETLSEYGWIDSKTTVDMLLRLFSGKGCMDSIKWIGSPGILQEIIKPWIKNEVITVYPNGIGHWPVVSQRFIDKKNHPMKELGHEEIKQKRNRAKIDEVVKILTR